jgi:hypothetical protein
LKFVGSADGIRLSLPEWQTRKTIFLILVMVNDFDKGKRQNLLRPRRDDSAFNKNLCFLARARLRWTRNYGYTTSPSFDWQSLAAGSMGIKT